MSAGVFVSKNGRVSKAVGAQPKEALLFAPASKNSSQILREQRTAMKRNNKQIKDRFAQATKRA
ncbi:hypothetical protein J25TS5_56720 [Paenibacillus faecis]|uniref:Uncharacterized protein n=1 Tax=Paenibacillus faecis TaxID=862114 RepID=A0A5D0CW47_9BACL|nr:MULTISPECIES: hypothetical protein [Paenibacillus]MCA1296319.1 hypothetical protein [Paenibacillus sp. alder61]TYA14151.1 hypothetical protein FRY98_00225 [Paenibacillus faecis]GIO88740.1 hypothetical protein J25TS5_56720 [Paenibacillus faecis]